MAIIHMVGVDRMCSIMAVDNEEIALATCNLFQCVNDSLTGGDKREYGKEEALVLGETHRQILVFYILYSERLHSNYFFNSLSPPSIPVILNKESVISADTSKDLKTILLSLLEMVGSKKVSGHGRDQALNLLSKNVPRKELKERDNSRTLFTIDHG